MIALQAYWKSSLGDNFQMPIKLIKVILPPKAYEGRGL